MRRRCMPHNSSLAEILKLKPRFSGCEGSTTATRGSGSGVAAGLAPEI